LDMECAWRSCGSRSRCNGGRPCACLHRSAGRSGGRHRCGRLPEWRGCNGHGWLAARQVRSLCLEGRRRRARSRSLARERRWPVSGSGDVHWSDRPGRSRCPPLGRGRRFIARRIGWSRRCRRVRACYRILCARHSRAA
jgi:hypothetical protein